MRRTVHLLKRAGREFVRNLIWMLVVFGLLATVLIFATDLPLLGVLAFGGVSVSVMAAILTVVVLWSGAHDETFLSGHNYPGSPPEGGGLEGWHGGGAGEGGGGGDSG
jgi:uncharacterized membrane protein YgcG